MRPQQRQCVSPNRVLNVASRTASILRGLSCHLGEPAGAFQQRKPREFQLGQSWTREIEGPLQQANALLDKYAAAVHPILDTETGGWLVTQGPVLDETWKLIEWTGAEGRWAGKIRPSGCAGAYHERVR